MKCKLMTVLNSFLQNHLLFGKWRRRSICFVLMGENKQKSVFFREHKQKNLHSHSFVLLCANSHWFHWQLFKHKAWGLSPQSTPTHLKMHFSIWWVFWAIFLRALQSIYQYHCLSRNNFGAVEGELLTVYLEAVLIIDLQIRLMANTQSSTHQLRHWYL